MIFRISKMADKMDGSPEGFYVDEKIIRAAFRDFEKYIFDEKTGKFVRARPAKAQRIDKQKTKHLKNIK